VSCPGQPQRQERLLWLRACKLSRRRVTGCCVLAYHSLQSVVSGVSALADRVLYPRSCSSHRIPPRTPPDQHCLALNRVQAQNCENPGMAGAHIADEARFEATGLTAGERDRLIVELRRRGYSQAKIGHRLGMSQQAIHLALDRLAGKTRRAPAASGVECAFCGRQVPQNQINADGYCETCEIVARPRARSMSVVCNPTTSAARAPVSSNEAHNGLVATVPQLLACARLDESLELVLGQEGARSPQHSCRHRRTGRSASGGQLRRRGRGFDAAVPGTDPGRLRRRGCGTAVAEAERSGVRRLQRPITAQRQPEGTYG
jgi:hypothetical protein